jgi:hypothetical protein
MEEIVFYLFVPLAAGLAIFSALYLVLLGFIASLSWFFNQIGARADEY